MSGACLGLLGSTVGSWAQLIGSPAGSAIGVDVGIVQLCCSSLEPTCGCLPATVHSKSGLYGFQDIVNMDGVELYFNSV